MKRIAGYFLQGLIIVVPVALTFWLLGGVFLTIDETVRQLLGRWLPGAALPGVGMLAMLTLITLVGFLGSHFFTRRLVQAFGALLERVPVVKMLYGALKDLLSAFVGPERRFDRPVTVTLSPGGGLRALGFITRDTLAQWGLAEDVAVYFPQSYNFAGQVLVVPRTAVTALDAPSADVMTFIVSGGISGNKETVPVK
jgi:uncharacterized membrane protein